MTKERAFNYAEIEAFYYFMRLGQAYSLSELAEAMDVTRSVAVYRMAQLKMLGGAAELAERVMGPSGGRSQRLWVRLGDRLAAPPRRRHRVIQALARGPAGLSELARRLGEDKTRQDRMRLANTVQRLVAEGLVEQTPTPGQRYVPFLYRLPERKQERAA